MDLLISSSNGKHFVPGNQLKMFVALCLIFIVMSTFTLSTLQAVSAVSNSF
jgi:hypothetical protein